MLLFNKCVEIFSSGWKEAFRSMRAVSFRACVYYIFVVNWHGFYALRALSIFSSLQKNNINRSMHWSRDWSLDRLLWDELIDCFLDHWLIVFVRQPQFAVWGLRRVMSGGICKQPQVMSAKNRNAISQSVLYACSWQGDIKHTHTHTQRKKNRQNTHTHLKTGKV